MKINCIMFRYTEKVYYIYIIIKRTMYKHKTMTGIPEQSQMLLTLEAFHSRIQGITTKIPTESFDKIIDGILGKEIDGIDAKDFGSRFEFDCGYDSVACWHDFKTFKIESDGDGYLVCLDLKVNYEVLRGEVVNDVSFSIENMEVYDNEGDEMEIDEMQAIIIKQAVESQNYKV